MNGGVNMKANLKNKRIILMISCIVIILITAIVALVTFRVRIKKLNERNITERVEDLRDLSYNKIYSKIADCYQILEAVSAQISTYSDIHSDEAINYAALQAKKLSYERIVIVKPNGESKFKDMTSELNVSERDYFKEAMAGKSNVSNAIKSYVSGKTSISIATPIYKNGSIIGIIYGIVDSRALYDYLNLNIQNVTTYAFSTYVDENNIDSNIPYGNFFIKQSEEDLVMHSNIFTFLDEVRLQNGITKDVVSLKIQNDESFFINFNYKGEKYFASFKTFEENNYWYFLTIIPSDYINEYASTLNYVTTTFFSEIIICTIFLFSITLVFFIINLRLVRSTADKTKQSEDRLKLALEISNNIVFDYDFEKKRIVYQSIPFQSFDSLELAGHIPEALFKLNIIDECSTNEFYNAYEKIRNGQKRVTCDVLINKMGESTWYRVIATNTNKLEYCTCTVRDITIEKNAQARLVQEKEYKRAISDKSLLSFDVDLETRKILNGSQKFMEMINEYKDLDYESTILFLSKEWIIENDHIKVQDFFSQKNMINSFKQGHDFLEIEFKTCKENKNSWIRASVHVVYDTVSKHHIMYALFDNIDAQKTLHEELQNKAEIDELTKLINRAKTVSVVNEYIAKKDKELFGAFIILDLDNFKRVNDTYGHMAGDYVLREFAANIRKNIKSFDLVGRIGGDEFVILLKDFKTREDIYSRCKSLIDLLAVEFTFGDQSFTQRCSIGVCIIDEDAIDFNYLYNNADRALYTSKRNGKSNFTISEK